MFKRFLYVTSLLIALFLVLLMFGLFIRAAVKADLQRQRTRVEIVNLDNGEVFNVGLNDITFKNACVKIRLKGVINGYGNFEQTTLCTNYSYKESLIE